MASLKMATKALGLAGCAQRTAAACALYSAVATDSGAAVAAAVEAVLLCSQIPVVEPGAADDDTPDSGPSNSAVGLCLPVLNEAAEMVLFFDYPAACVALFSTWQARTSQVPMGRRETWLLAALRGLPGGASTYHCFEALVGLWCNPGLCKVDISWTWLVGSALALRNARVAILTTLRLMPKDARAELPAILACVLNAFRDGQCVASTLITVLQWLLAQEECMGPVQIRPPWHYSHEWWLLLQLKGMLPDALVKQVALDAAHTAIAKLSLEGLRVACSVLMQRRDEDVLGSVLAACVNRAVTRSIYDGMPCRTTERAAVELVQDYFPVRPTSAHVGTLVRAESEKPQEVTRRFSPQLATELVQATRWSPLRRAWVQAVVSDKTLVGLPPPPTAGGGGSRQVKRVRV
jgi:hypothetical protein